MRGGTSCLFEQTLAAISYFGFFPQAIHPSIPPGSGALLMQKVALLAGLVLCGAIPAHAQSQAERLEGLAALIAGDNCRVLRSEADALFGDADFGDPAEVLEMMFTLVLSGRAALDEEGMRLLDPGCPVEGFTPPEDLAQVAAYVAALEGNACEMLVGDARPVLGGAGVTDPNTAGRIGALLLADGRLVVLTDPYRLRVVSAACPAQ